MKVGDTVKMKTKPGCPALERVGIVVGWDCEKKQTGFVRIFWGSYFSVQALKDVEPATTAYLMGKYEAEYNALIPVDFDLLREHYFIYPVGVDTKLSVEQLPVGKYVLTKDRGISTVGVHCGGGKVTHVGQPWQEKAEIVDLATPLESTNEDFFFTEKIKTGAEAIDTRKPFQFFRYTGLYIRHFHAEENCLCFVAPTETIRFPYFDVLPYMVPNGFLKPLAAQKVLDTVQVAASSVPLHAINDCFFMYKNNVYWRQGGSSWSIKTGKPVRIPAKYVNLVRLHA